jgi:hypothetical protein
MGSPATCGTHRAMIYRRGGQVAVGEVVAITSLTWDRRRDDISQAWLTVGLGCCGLMSQVHPVEHELHIYRDGDPVWQGVITRLEFSADEVGIWAEDMLWVPKRRVIEKGWDYNALGNNAPHNVDIARRLLVDDCYARYGDQWRMAGNVATYHSPATRSVGSKVNAYQFTVWQVLDDMARYFDLDYTVVNRTVHLWDVHHRWRTAPTLMPQHISNEVRIVEYGNQTATRYIRTDGSGYAGVAVADAASLGRLGRYVDLLSNTTPADEEPPDKPPSANRLKKMQEEAEERLGLHNPTPVAVVVPEGSTLFPNAPYDIATLTPGVWFMVYYDHPCRSGGGWHKLQELRVVENGTEGERVEIRTISAPLDAIDTQDPGAGAGP